MSGSLSQFYFVGATLCVCVLYSFYNIVTRRRKDLPPGPRSAPFFGNALQLPKLNQHLKMTEWARQYGRPSDIAGVQMVNIERNTDYRGHSLCRVLWSTSYNCQFLIGSNYTCGKAWREVFKQTTYALPERAISLLLLTRRLSQHLLQSVSGGQAISGSLHTTMDGSACGDGFRGASLLEQPLIAIAQFNVVKFASCSES